MSQKIAILSLSVLAVEGISAATFITLDGSTAEAGGDAHGVAVTDAAANDLFPADVLGTSIVKAGAAITRGAKLEVGAGGTAVPQTSGQQVAIAVEDASQGADVEVLLILGGPTPAGA